MRQNRQLGLHSIATFCQDADKDTIAPHVFYGAFIQIVSIVIIVFKNLADRLGTL